MAQTNGHNGHPRAGVMTDDRPLGDLFQELAAEARELVNLELALARKEVSEKAGQMGKGAGMAAAGGFVIYAGFLAIIAAAILALAYLMPTWLAALIVGVVVGVVGYLVLRSGMNKMKNTDLTPQRTVQTLKEDKQFVQSGMSETSVNPGGK